jgi:phosphate transport system substrate-binding protein
MFKLLVALLLIAGTSVAGQFSLPVCGPDGGKVEIAGSSTVFPLADAWAAGYRARCPKVNVTVEGGGSFAGASRVCGSGGSTVDIGTMSRTFNIPAEVNVTDAATSQFICNQGDPSRKTIQVEVGVDGIVVLLVWNGLAAQCLQKTPGLTIGQLRWMYSNFSEAQQGLDTPEKVKAVIPNSDGNSTSRNWSDLERTCPVTNIRIAGPDPASETFQFFQEVVFLLCAQGESFETRREGGYFSSSLNQIVVNYLETSYSEIYGDAIAYFSFSVYQTLNVRVYAVPIKNDAINAYVEPTRVPILNGLYKPFSRRVYMQLYNNDTSLANTKPFLAFGLSNAGSQISTGIVGLLHGDRIAQLARLGLPPPNDLAAIPGPAPTSFVEDDDVCLAPPYSCGLFKLNLLCLNGCGFIGRLLGWCKYT